MDSVSEILGKLAAVGPARRGQLSEQFYTVIGKDGKQRKQGPYYVLTWSDNGEKKTKRISEENVARVREELRAGKEIDDLILLFRKIKEAEADANIPQKKTVQRNGGNMGLKSRRQLTRYAKTLRKKASFVSPRLKRR